ncbi:MAG: hypothetical protein KJO08_05440 [Gammaproteobacteria bacterium]|nr:hypothetical protein [Gammaproteobacteria bacterium]NNJ83369.1 hypothetical protein [Gammaproteobacteria bacterium]
MNTNAQQLLDHFERLPFPDRQEVAREILRHTVDCHVPPSLNNKWADDALPNPGDELFRKLDRAEGMSNDQWQQFVYETEGSISDPTFRRHPQGAFEQRDEVFP